MCEKVQNLFFIDSSAKQTKGLLKLKSQALLKI